MNLLIRGPDRVSPGCYAVYCPHVMHRTISDTADWISSKLNSAVEMTISSPKFILSKHIWPVNYSYHKSQNKVVSSICCCLAARETAPLMTCQLFPYFTESLSSLLWNLHKYYSQFSDCIQTRISQLRQPIEKELKVYIYYIFISVSFLLHTSTLSSVHTCQSNTVMWIVVLRTLSRSPSGTMSVSGPSNSRWIRPIGKI